MAASRSSRLVVLIIVTTAAAVALAQDCDANKKCANNMCCSQWGYCGCTSEYCASGCKSQCNGCGAGGSSSIGINYGRVGNNLPSSAQVVKLLQGRGITDVKIYDAAGDVLRAFAKSGISLSIAITNHDVPNIADNQAAANSWVQNNVRAYPSTKISSIAVGNEYLSDGSNDVSKLVPAMQNIQRALEASGLSSIKVSTPHAFDVMGVSYPPSAGAFKDKYTSVIRSISEFLAQRGSPFMVNIYPYFAYRENPGQINLDYALFNPNAPTVHDSGRQYRNLFDAQLDSVIAALNRLGHGNLHVAVSESGWPSAGGFAANVLNAKTYNNNLVKHVLGNSGTPMRPGTKIPTNIFALFNENLKPGDAIEKNWGLFYPNQSRVYDIQLSAVSLAESVM